MRRRRPILTLLLVVPVALALVGGIWLGGHPRYLPGGVADALLGGSEDRVVAEALDEIDSSYFREPDRARIADAAIKGAVSKLDDRFSAYFTPQEFNRFEDVTNSRFTGIGVTVRGVDRGLRVETVFDDSPAKRAGLRREDVIVAAGGRSLAGKSSNVATALVKGPAGTRVALRIRRGSDTITRKVSRATISVPVVASEILRAGGERVSHIKLATFSSGAHAELSAAIRKARDRDAKGIVLDLRGNGGGLVTEAQLVASAFLQRGEVVTTRGRSVPTRTLSAVGQPVARDLPVVVLVDGGTASASEIVTAALQDHQRATVVGMRTFGKGVFQEIIPLSNGGALDLTVGQYFTPDGRNLGGAGVKTGAGIKPAVKASDDEDTKRDEALRTALRVLAGKL